MNPYFSYFLQFPFINSVIINFQSNATENITNQPLEVVQISSSKDYLKVQDNNFELPLSRKDLISKSYQVTKHPWTEQQDFKLKDYIDNKGLTWKQVAKLIPGRNQKMCYSRYRRLQIDSKFHWTKSDNEEILSLVDKYGTCWKVIGHFFTKRTPKQIREHYLNHLRPHIVTKDWTVQQDELLLQLVQKDGNKWKKFQKQFEGRTENQIKNRFYGRLKKMIQKKTHKKKIKN